MQRFRFTILAVCMILAWLGYNELSLAWRNPQPQEISLQQLLNGEASREWLTVTGGYQDLPEAINMSGTIEVDAFLVPLKNSPDAATAQVWFETRDPQISAALKTYYFSLDSDAERARYRDQNRALFSAQRTVTGMLVSNLIADSNRQKLTSLLEQMGIPSSAEAIFISEGKQPNRWRGYFFSGLACIGIARVLFDLLRSPRSDSADSASD